MTGVCERHRPARRTTTGKRELFDRLREFLLEKPAASDYDRLAVELGLRRNTLTVAVHRLRDKLRQQLRRELAETVSREEDVELELDELRATLGAVLH